MGLKLAYEGKKKEKGSAEELIVLVLLVQWINWLTLYTYIQRCFFACLSFFLTLDPPQKVPHHITPTFFTHLYVSICLYDTCLL